MDGKLDSSAVTPFGRYSDRNGHGITDPEIVHFADRHSDYETTRIITLR
jgi:hypothetical protein